VSLCIKLLYGLLVEKDLRNEIKTLSFFDQFEYIRSRNDPTMFYTQVAHYYKIPYLSLDSLWVDDSTPVLWQELPPADHMDIIPVYATQHDYALATSNPFHPYLQVVADTWPLKRPRIILMSPGDIYHYHQSKSNDPLANLVFNGIDHRASDIHIYNRNEYGHVYYRILGQLTPIYTLPPQSLRQLVNQLIFRANLKLGEHQRPQDGRLTLHAAQEPGKPVDTRVSVIPTHFGYDVAIRIFHQNIHFSLKNCGFQPRQHDQLLGLIRKESGLILVTGTTGSGKTTTLYALLHELNHAQKNIVTLEDPIEYHFDFMRQTQINLEAGYTFGTGLRATLRQDPDIIMLGEIRDSETATIACQAAYTGHLVPASLHSHSVAGVWQRLEQLGVSNAMLQGCLRGIIHQKLVPTPCTVCRGHGCSNCLGTGTFGQALHAEIVVL
tara:strand:+ start:2038 stop:3351 length:1314 start_codon:yes stop_codon:yes gene_type:complete